MGLNQVLHISLLASSRQLTPELYRQTDKKEEGKLYDVKRREKNKVP